MTVEPPNREQIAEYATRQQLELSDEELENELQRVAAFVRTLAQLEALAQPAIRVKFPARRLGRQPRPGEDQYNAISCFCDVRGSSTGPLVGIRVGVKDNISVAGIAMLGVTREDVAFVPSEDAVVVERLLEAGAVITAKTTIDVARNPRNPRFSPGGSSSGSAAAVAAGIIDAALGADQGGSIRAPAAWCGLVGMKATHGLVPSYGLLYWDHGLDHIGPITTTVADNALMLEVLAGSDWRDPHPADVHGAAYTGAAHGGISDLRVGVVEESLQPSGCTTSSLDTFEHAQNILRSVGAEIASVSVPLWSNAPAIWWAAVATGLTLMDYSLGQGFGHSGRIDIRLLEAAAAEHLNDARELRAGGRTFPLVLEHLRHACHGVPLAKAHNLRLELRRQIDFLLNSVDLLITPTTPTGPPPLATDDPPATTGELFGNGHGSPLRNCCPTNLTGHPALTIPMGMDENGLPLGLQIIGRRFDETTIYRAAFAYEGTGSFRA